MPVQEQPQEQLESIVRRINTGTENPDTSRALVVFNLTSHPLTGIATFWASMSWPRNMPLPPVAVTDSEGVPVPAAVHDMMQDTDAKGRADRVQLGFAISFAAAAVPASGWRTYIASYADAPGPPLNSALLNADLIVIETTRHGGDLPMLGCFQ